MNDATRPYNELRARIARLGLTTSGMARRMQELGDDRQHKTIQRAIQRTIAGRARISGEMLALLGLMEVVHHMLWDESPELKAPTARFPGQTHEIELFASVEA